MSARGIKEGPYQDILRTTRRRRKKKGANDRTGRPPGGFMKKSSHVPKDMPRPHAAYPRMSDLRTRSPGPPSPRAHSARRPRPCPYPDFISRPACAHGWVVGSLRGSGPPGGMANRHIGKP